MKKQSALTRRDLLRSGSAGVGLISLASHAPTFLVDAALAQSPGAGADGKTLVIIQLAGGNDGLNTIIQHQDDAYYKRRPTLALKEHLKLTEYLGLHTAMKEAHAMYEESNMAAILNVGYPNPNRSHFRSTDIYHWGSKERSKSGWVGRFLDAKCAGFDKEFPVAINIGANVPQTFNSRRLHKVYSSSPGEDDSVKASAVDRDMLNDADTLNLLKKTIKGSSKDDNALVSYLSASYMDALVEKEKMDAIMDGYAPDTEYPRSGLATSLRNIASFIAKGLPTRVYYASIGGFDTHQGQLGRHNNLLTTLSQAVGAFYADLKAKKLDEQVLTMTFTEFGRRVDENGSQGTDHGTVTPMFVFGPQVNGGIYGKEPYDISKVGGDLPFDGQSTDFRSVYSTILANWLGCPPSEVFKEEYELLSFV